jgi:RNA polymerase sigma factor (sigma-70 family)
MQDFDWNGFFRRYAPMARGFVSGIVGDGDLANDLFQEAARTVFERASDGRVRFESNAHARNYLFKVLRNLAVDARRRPRPVSGVEVGSLPDPAASPAERSARDGLDAEVRRAIRALRPAESDALRLRYLEGLSYRQIADRTGAAISTLQARVEAALAKIRTRVGKPGGDA